ncbi:MAG: phosphatase PAP2 family protein [bacterium]|nr:phosphatase PAP2 family protein [bacterium]
MKSLQAFLKKYGHAWILSYVIVYLIWFFHLEKTVTRDYTVVHSRLDDYIPFNEYFIVPYLLWFLYVAGTVLYFFFTNRQDYYRVCAFLFTGMTLSLIICSVFPNGTNFRPSIDPDKNIFCWMVSRLYQADTCTNVFPSIHVFNSIAVHTGITHSEAFRSRPRIRLASFVLTLSICMATVFLKQHSVLDIAGACLMAAMIYPFIYSLHPHSSYKEVPEL